MKGIEYIRKLYGKSLNDVAKHLNVTNQVVSTWEKKNNIPHKRLSELSTYFGLPAEYFDAELTDDLKEKIDYTKWQIETYNNGYNALLFDADDSEITDLFLKLKKTVINNGTINGDRIKLINDFLDVFDSNSCSFLQRVISAVKLSNTRKQCDDIFVETLTQTMKIWKRHRKKERKEYEELKKQTADFEELY